MFAVSGHEVSLQRVAYALCAALEGGINYWVTDIVDIVPPEYTFADESNDDPECGHYRHELPCNPGGALIITADDDEPGKTYRLDLDSLATGLQVMHSKYPNHFTDMVEENEDADTGDVLVQCCLFGETVYG